jgi:site-specific DNA-methyltransferase (adenine-specific)
LDKLKELEDNSIDSIVTDPPYGLSFMGKKWDYDVPSQEIWEECLRVLKPGGYLLAFAGTRTQHRMAVRIEDAGFEIRDMIAWVYGSGFPKSLNIGKAVDKLQGNEREVVGEKISADGKPASARLAKTARGGEENGDIYGVYKNDKEKTCMETKGTSEWEGYGTALKPALEPITVARKPISEKTVAENVLKYGTGGINIDGCRVEAEPELAKNWTNRKAKAGFGNSVNAYDPQNPNTTIDNFDYYSAQGRFPANLITDGSDAVVGLFPSPHSAGDARTSEEGTHGGKTGIFGIGEPAMRYGDSGSAARFFYCAKASKSERNKGLEEFEEKAGIRTNAPRENEEVKNPVNKNHHPTVKPISLMRYLCRLVTPKGGTVLDPFMGSGTTGIGAKLEGFDFIGIEREAEYIKIAEARINAWQKDNKLL